MLSLESENVFRIQVGTVKNVYTHSWHYFKGLLFQSKLLSNADQDLSVFSDGLPAVSKARHTQIRKKLNDDREF